MSTDPRPSHMGRDMIVSAVLTTFIERVALSRRMTRPKFARGRFKSYAGVKSLAGEILLFLLILAFERLAEMVVHDLISLFGNHDHRPRRKKA